MIPSATTLSTTTETGTAAVDADRPVVEGRDRRALLVGAVAIVAAVGIAAGGALLVRSTTTEPTAPAAPAPLTARTAEVDHVSHGGPGSRADIIATAAVPAAALPDEVSHGGPGSRTDAVHVVAPTVAVPLVTAVEARVADVAHGTAGSIVSATAARP